MASETISIPYSEIVRLIEKWEPEASHSPITYRQATCIKCAEPMVEMYHVWANVQITDGRWFCKEIHVCLSCGGEYVVRDPLQV